MTTALSMSNPASSDAKSLPQSWTVRIFDRLSGQLGSKMADLYSGVPAETVQAEWAAALAEYHPNEIARGLAACSERSFAPVLGEFLRLCRPALDPEWAFYEAADGLRQRDAGEVGNWSHPAVWRAACTMGSEVRAGDWKAHRSRWTYTLRREFDAGWGDIPAPAIRIGHEVKAGGPPSAAQRAELARMRDLLASSRSRP
jgi:hypothetical protein